MTDEIVRTSPPEKIAIASGPQSKRHTCVHPLSGVLFGLSVLASLALLGCGEGEPTYPVSYNSNSGAAVAGGDQPLFDDPNAQNDPAVVPGAPSYTEQLAAISALEDVINPTPELIAVETLAGSGLQVGVTAGIESTPDMDYIEAQWMAMQACTEQTAVPPLLIVTAYAPAPMTASDDVMTYLDGSVAATSRGLDTGAVAQIRIDDIEGTLLNSTRGFYLRSILARLLWTQAGLAERYYPYECPIDGY